MPKLELPPDLLPRLKQAVAALARDAAARSQSLKVRIRDAISTMPQDWRAIYAASNRATPQSQRYAAIALVVALHIAVIWALATSLRFVRLGDEISVLQVTTVSPAFGNADPKPSPINPTLIAPQSVLVPEPTIEIAEDARQSSGVTAIDMSRLLPPRPDPAHANGPPELPARLKSLGNAVSAILRVFVLADGSISDAQITRSSGDRALDAIAIAYVKENWRFIAASASGQPVPDWTTVLVPFRAS
jgi:TonB family protein